MTHALHVANDHDGGIGVLLLNVRNGPDEGVTTSVRFDAAVHKGDELILISQNSVISNIDLNFALIFCGLCIISNAIMNS